MYMAVTPDEYELPLSVRDTAEELAKIFGVSTNTIYSSASRGDHGASRGVKFVSVKIPKKELREGD